MNLGYIKICKRFLIFPMLLSLLFLLVACGTEEPDGLHQFTEYKDTRLLRINIKDYGNIDFRIYPDSEPEVAGKFIELAENGFYNGKVFFAFIEDYLALGGEETLLSNPQTIVEKTGEAKLYPFYGALCVSMDENNRCDAGQFYIINSDAKSIENMRELVEFKGYTFNDYIKFGYSTELEEEELELFYQYGGAPWLMGHTCVIGQAYEGMDILEEICKDYKNGDGTDKYVIESIETDQQTQ